MFKNNATPSPKASDGFFSKLRRNMHLSPRHASALTKPPGSRGTRDLPSPSSSRSSNVSSPRSKSQLTPPPRRHAALFSKITFGTTTFIEDRYVYSSSPDYAVPGEVLYYNAVETGPYFSIPASKEAYIQRLDELFFEGKSRSPVPQETTGLPRLPEIPLQSHLRSAFQEMFDFPPDPIPLPDLAAGVELSQGASSSDPTTREETKDSIADLLSALSASLRNDPTEFSPGLFNWETENATRRGEDETATQAVVPRALRTQLSIPVLKVPKTSLKPMLSRQRRVSPRSRAKSSPVKGDDSRPFNLSPVLDSLPPTCFALPPESSIGMAL